MNPSKNGEIYRNNHLELGSVSTTVSTMIRKFEPSRKLIRINEEIQDLTRNKSHYNLPQSHQSPSTMIEPIQIPRAHFDNSQSK